MSYNFGKLNEYAERAHKNSKSKGFWHGQNPKDVYIRLGKLALITEEIGEAVSAVRHKDDANFLEELADICIRVFDLAEANGMSLESAIVDKMNTNEKRPYMHGKSA